MSANFTIHILTQKGTNKKTPFLSTPILFVVYADIPLSMHFQAAPIKTDTHKDVTDSCVNVAPCKFLEFHHVLIMSRILSNATT